MNKLFEHQDWPTQQAMERLDGPIRAYCARREREKREKREALAFALAMAAAFSVAVVGLTVGFAASWLWVVAGAMGLTLMLSPVLAYFVEEARYEEE